jgi:hypothetical protein
MAISCLSLLTVKPVNAQSTPVPAVPKFTLKLAGPSLTFNTTYSLDPNTGQIVPNIGYTNQYSDLEIIINNQPYSSKSGTLYYNIRISGHNTNDWDTLYNMNNNGMLTQSTDSDYTDVSFSVETSIDSNFGILEGNQIDVEVIAMLGTYQWTRTPAFDSGHYAFSGENSSWSNPQTISIPANVPLSSQSSPLPTSSPSPILTSTSTPTSAAASSFSATSFWQITSAISLLVIAILLAVIIALILYFKRRKP